MKKILVPLDGSELAEAVLPHVIQLAKCMGAMVELLSVLPKPAFEYAFPDPILSQVHEEHVRYETLAYLSRTASRLTDERVDVVTQLGEGAVGGSIVQTAGDVGADLIAMSTHGRGGLARLVIGSVADHVVRQAKVPMLLVHPNAQ